MSFAKEVADAKAKPATTEAVKFDKTEIFDLPQVEVPIEHQPLATGNAPVDPKGIQASKDPIIKIGDMEFTSKEDAIEYARVLDNQRREENAYVKGVQAALPREPEVPVKSLEEQVEEILFEDPKQAVGKITSFVRDTINSEIKNSFQTRDQAAIDAQNSMQFWNEFKTEHKDLANHGDVIKYIYKEDPQGLEALALKDRAAAKLEIANRARKVLRGYRESNLPEIEMQSGPSTVVSSNGGRSTSVATRTETSSFIDQVNKMRKKG